MTTSPTLIVGCSLAAVAVAVGAACRARRSESDPPGLEAPAYMPTATVKDIMLGVVDPSADVVWNAVNTEVGPEGTLERAPHTADEWDAVRLGAIRLAEASNLLLMPGRHVARPGERSAAPGVELEPEEMESLILKDRQSWNDRARALHEASIAAIEAIDARDAPRLFDLGERLEQACESCHSHYWYPNQVLPPGYEEPQLRSSTR